MVYFNNYHLIQLKRKAETIADLYHQSVSEGALVVAVKEVACQLVPVNETVKDYPIQTEEVVHFDEGGMREDGLK